jgi:two-component system, sensor histidine kinase ChiS
MQNLDQNAYYENFEASALIKDRTRLHVNVTLTAIFDETGQINGFTAVIRDIHKEKQLQDEVSAKNVALGNTNSELVKMNMELKRLNELKTNFLSVASHELRTPLTSIRGYTDILVDSMRDKMEASIYKIVQTISKATNRLHQTVNDILDMTRIEQKHVRLSLESLDVAQLLRESVEEAGAFSQQRHIVLQLDLGDSLPPLEADKFRIQQVIMNLIYNGIKFTPDGKEITVSARLQNGFIHITISDQGIGIETAELNSIFTPFYEAKELWQYSSGNLKFLGRGLGLGLAIARGIVELHHGKIWAESIGQDREKLPGSQFHVLLPLHPIPASETFAPTPQAVSTLSGQIQASRCLLFIGSDTHALTLIRKSLAKVFVVEAAQSAGTGIEMAFRLLPALIVMEMPLEGLSAFAACEILKSQLHTSKIPIAILTAGINSETLEKGFQAGADEFLFRPLDEKELTDKALQLLMGKKSAQSPGKPR